MKVSDTVSLYDKRRARDVIFILALLARHCVNARFARSPREGQPLER